MINFLKRWGLLQFTEKDIQPFLNEKAKIQFIRKNTYVYYIIFYHPLYKSWWILPDFSWRVWIHSPWSLLQKGSYGAYDLNALTCKYEEISDYKQKFATLQNIQEYFDKISSKYFENEAEEEKINKKYPKKLD